MVMSAYPPSLLAQVRVRSTGQVIGKLWDGTLVITESEWLEWEPYDPDLIDLALNGAVDELERLLVLREGSSQ